MRNVTKKLGVWILTLTMLFSMGITGYAQESLEAYYIKAIVKTIAENYKFDISEEELYEKVIDYVMEKNPQLLEGAIAAVSNDLDEFSQYMSAEELSDFTGYIDQSYVGIGVTIERMVGYVGITAVTPSSPAEKAGVMAGDKILEVDGVDVTSYSVANLQAVVRGEEGSPVALTLGRGDDKKVITIIRGAIKASSIAYKEEDGIGYIRITRFNSGTPKEVSDALSTFSTTKLIVDLRNNPGGELGGVINTLNLFVPKGMVLTSVDYNGEENDTVIKSKAEFTKAKYNIAVLINENSASASELFAGAIKDNKLGTVIGVRSYGKGTVQEFLGLNSPRGKTLGDIKLTVGEYFLPNGESIHKTGVVPDIKVKNETHLVDTTTFEPFIFEGKYKVGDAGKGVLAIEQRLDALGYYVGEVDGSFDRETELAVSNFQSDAGLYSYGVMDITTQNKLNDVINTVEIAEDTQLDYAKKFLTEGK